MKKDNNFTTLFNNCNYLGNCFKHGFPLSSLRKLDLRLWYRAWNFALLQILFLGQLILETMINEEEMPHSYLDFLLHLLAFSKLNSNFPYPKPSDHSNHHALALYSTRLHLALNILSCGQCGCFTLSATAPSVPDPWDLNLSGKCFQSTDVAISALVFTQKAVDEVTSSW